MMTSTIALPPWFQRWNQFPVASGSWVIVKLPSHERSVLVATQEAWTELMVSLPRANVAGKERWLQLRQQYAATRNPALLAELDQIGERGTILTEQLRTRSHAIKDAARRLAHERGCGVIYARVFRLAFGIVLERLAIDEKAQRQMCAVTKIVFQPSEIMWSLANLGVHYQTNAEAYGQETTEGDPALLPVPSHALGDLWRGIKEGK